MDLKYKNYVKSCLLKDYFKWKFIWSAQLSNMIDKILEDEGNLFKHWETH